jgi:hypothetical protein
MKFWINRIVQTLVWTFLPLVLLVTDNPLTSIAYYYTWIATALGLLVSLVLVFNSEKYRSEFKSKSTVVFNPLYSLVVSSITITVLFKYDFYYLALLNAIIFSVIFGFLSKEAETKEA